MQSIVFLAFKLSLNCQDLQLNRYLCNAVDVQFQILYVIFQYPQVDGAIHVAETYPSSSCVYLDGSPAKIVLSNTLV